MAAHVCVFVRCVCDLGRLFVCMHARMHVLCAYVSLFVCADANKAAVAAKGGIDAVLAAMRRHEGVAGVAKKGFNALCICVFTSLGGCSVVVSARLVGRW